MADCTVSMPPPPAASGLITLITSCRPLASPAASAPALLKTMCSPSAEIPSAVLAVVAWPPSVPTETRAIACVCTFFTKTSATPLVSPATRLAALLLKTT